MTQTCEVCGQAAETADHLIFQCLVANSSWTHLGFQNANTIYSRALEPEQATASSVIFLLNFRPPMLLADLGSPSRSRIPQSTAKPTSPTTLMQRRNEAARLLAHRLRPIHRHIADAWCNLFVMN